MACRACWVWDVQNSYAVMHTLYCRQQLLYCTVLYCLQQLLSCTVLTTTAAVTAWPASAIHTLSARAAVTAWPAQVSLILLSTAGCVWQGVEGCRDVSGAQIWTGPARSRCDTTIGQSFCPADDNEAKRSGRDTATASQMHRCGAEVVQMRAVACLPGVMRHKVQGSAQSHMS